MKTGWKRSPLGDVCEFVRGPFGGALKKSIFKPSGFAVYEQRNAIYNQFSDIRYFIDAAKFQEMSRFELKPNDIIMSCSGTMGKVAIVPDGIPRGIINQALLKLTVKEKLLTPYLNLWMGSPDFQEQLDKLTVGAAIKNVASVKNLKQIQIPLPSLKEQKRIVAILDEAFAGLARARAHTEANLQNARDLFASAVGKAFSTQSTEPTKLGELSKIEYGYTAKASSEEIGPKFLRITDIQDGEVDWDNVPFCKIDPKKHDKFKMAVGDIVFARTGATTGKSWLMSEHYDAVFASYLIRVRTLEAELLPEFLAFYFHSDGYWQDVEKGTDGAAQGGFNASKLAAMEIKIPPIENQKVIVKTLNEQLASSKQLQAFYQSKLKNLDDLRQSLLQKAFAGELT